MSKPVQSIPYTSSNNMCNQAVFPYTILEINGNDVRPLPYHLNTELPGTCVLTQVARLLWGHPALGLPWTPFRALGYCHRSSVRSGSWQGRQKHPLALSRLQLFSDPFQGRQRHSTSRFRDYMRFVRKGPGYLSFSFNKSNRYTC